VQPLANSFIRPDELEKPEPRYPLELARCTACGHVQLSVTVPPEIMFRNYLYVSGTSDTIPAHFAAYAKDVAERFVPKGGLVVEIGSNDGTLLRAFDRGTVRVLGVEPARNIAAMANAAGIPTLDEFFSEAIASEIAAKHGRAAAIIGNNVVAHIDDLHGLMNGVTNLLDERGVFVAEFPYLVDLLEKTAYDTIYHEHLSYFSVGSVDDLASRHGLRLIDVRRVGVHGGSIRVFIMRDGDRSPKVTALLALEESAGLRAGHPLGAFVQAVRRQREDLKRVLWEIRSSRHLGGYGAPAKGNTMLNYCGIDRSVLDFIVDRSPLKHGLLTPGTHVPVEPPERLLTSNVRDTLLLAWNFADEILRQQEAYRSRGGRFIVPIPSPRVV
jgi:C-methyltransferase C-terminal domain/Putative zinc binding domain/Methyltransferase domain